MSHIRLTAGHVYDLVYATRILLRHAGWTAGDGSGHEG